MATFFPRTRRRTSFFTESLRRVEPLCWTISSLRSSAFPCDEKKTAKSKKVKERFLFGDCGFVTRTPHRGETNITPCAQRALGGNSAHRPRLKGATARSVRRRAARRSRGGSCAFQARVLFEPQPQAAFRRMGLFLFRISCGCVAGTPGGEDVHVFVVGVSVFSVNRVPTGRIRVLSVYVGLKPYAGQSRPVGAWKYAPAARRKCLRGKSDAAGTKAGMPSPPKAFPRAKRKPRSQRK